MTAITENILRIAHFTSSEAYRLIPMGSRKMTKKEIAEHKKQFPKSQKKTIESGFGALGLSYIKEKNNEIKLGRSIDLNKSSASTAWGEFLEQRVHDMLDTGYELLSKITMPHPVYGDFWSGSQDNVHRAEKIVCDTKCYEPENFANYNDVLLRAKETNDFTEWKKDFKKEYWQLISNACIWGFDTIEAILYMPYESEIEDIRKEAENYLGDEPWRFRFIYESHKSKLPYLPDGNKFYKNLNIYRFTAPKEDKDFLTQRMIEASRLLAVIPPSEKGVPEAASAGDVAVSPSPVLGEGWGEVVLKNIPPLVNEEDRKVARKKLEHGKTLKSKLNKKFEAVE